MYTRVEDYIDLNDKSIKWYDIPGFNGYQLSTTGHIRSLKHFKKYPFGMLIKHQNGYFTLTDCNNKRTRISYNKICELVNSDEHSLAYPMDTINTSHSSRNRVCVNLSDLKLFNI